ncbi:MAG: ABC transporter permease [Roseiarcus sp.]
MLAASAGAARFGALRNWRARRGSCGAHSARVEPPGRVSYRPTSGDDLMEVGFLDLAQGITRLPVALFFSWSDTKARYKRSVLGPFWLVLSTLVGVGGLGLIWGVLLKVDKAEFIPSLTIGLIIWQLISGSISEGAGIFYRQAAFIKDINVPSFFVSIQLILKQLINFCHNIFVFVIVMIIFPEHISVVAFLAIPGLIIVILNMVWIIQLLGYVGARYRDLEPLIVTFLPILFFLSPVVYRASQLGTLAHIMTFNPLTYWIGLVRDPILGVVPSFQTYALAAAVTVAGWAAALWMTASRRHRLPYWI